MDDNGRNSADVLRIAVNGRLYCTLTGDVLRIGDLEVTLVRFSKRWMGFKPPEDPAEKPPVYFGHAELKVNRTDQPYVAITLLIATAVVGVALAKAIDALHARRRLHAPM